MPVRKRLVTELCREPKLHTQLQDELSKNYLGYRLLKYPSDWLSLLEGILCFPSITKSSKSGYL